MTPDRKRILLNLWIARKPRFRSVVDYDIREHNFVMTVIGGSPKGDQDDPHRVRGTC